MTEPRHARAATDPEAADPVLRDRLWAIPFDSVWQAAYRLANGGLRGWKIASADDHEGFIEATVQGLGSWVHDVRIEIGLDADGQTYARAVISARAAGTDLGRARRRLRRFLKALDRAVARMPRPGLAGRDA
ncbi:MAG TPA: hypothetical protein VK929_12935 [Longimicrobiales bacterium]|nr:hypothetical protein [Longimicrobiales bacterium]